MAKYLIYSKAEKFNNPLVEGYYLSGADYAAIEKYAQDTLGLDGEYYLAKVDDTDKVKFTIGTASGNFVVDGWNNPLLNIATLTAGIDKNPFVTENSGAVVVNGVVLNFLIYPRGLADNVALSGGYIVNHNTFEGAIATAVTKFDLVGDYWITTFSSKPRKIEFVSFTNATIQVGVWSTP